MLATAGVVAPSMAQYKFWVHTSKGNGVNKIKEYSIAETDSISYATPNYKISDIDGISLANSITTFDSAQMAKTIIDEESVEKFINSTQGPFLWNGFDDKFSWLIGDVLSGNVYYTYFYFDEGEFFHLTFSNSNANIYNGFRSLYGVIAKCNQIINDLPNACKSNNIDQSIIDRTVGEAKMYRGLAYFYLAEYWGAMPLVLSSDQKRFECFIGACPRLTIKADRATLYAQIEKDWKDAYELLPSKRWGDSGVRATKVSAAGMLTKLYVTKASCQTEIEGDNNYVCADPNAMYQKAIDWADKTLELNNYLEDGYENYDKMFWPNSQSKEILFALNFEEGEYGAGSSRQIEFARSKHVAGGGNAYGGEKGLTVTLFDSYEKEDIRKKATCYYQGDDEDYSDRLTKNDAEAGLGHYYEMYDGSKYYYFLNPSISLPKSDRDQFYGNEPLSPVLNHCRKFVYGMKLSENEYSAPITFPILRTADVYLLRAEAKMGLASSDVASESTAGLEDVNIIRKRAGLDPVDKIAFCEPDEVILNGDVAYATVENYYGRDEEITASCDKYYPTYDLMMERRHEFALESQNWLDIKRLYYRNPKAAKDYITSQDRSYKFGVKFGSMTPAPQRKSDFQRQSLIDELSRKAHEISYSYYETSWSEREVEIEYNSLSWFLPIPAASYPAREGAMNFEKEIAEGTYPY